MTIQSSVERKYRKSPRAPLLPQAQSQKHDNLEAHEAGIDGASFSGAVFNLSTTIVGAGIMALPATVMELGLIPGLIMIVLVGWLTESSIDMIMRFSRASKSATYSGVVADAFGGAGRALLQVCIVVNNLGMLVVYMIIIGDVLSGAWLNGVHHSGVTEEWFGQHWWTTRFTLLLLTTLFVFLPLISFRRVDSLRYTSALSVGLAIVFVVITAGVAVVKTIDGSISMPRLLPEISNQASFWKLFTTFPVLVTAYICHHNIHPIENELKDPTQIKSIVRTSITLCSTVYITTSFFGLLLFGDRTLDDVLANFDVTAALMGFIFVGANFVPSIWDAFQFTGATAAVSVGFIFPAAIALRDTHGIATKNDRLASWLMISLAVSSSTVAVSSDIYSIFNGVGG
ncbi:amino acid transporter AVT6B-like isoform X2 [Citrus sinensis]|uniref:amino acid transporter AVT6B-like isoform X2 n=1 Tax=Citrus sinensis TaxID=2711 RepID=UPI0022776C5B|nr:amino acid transporter AVT6B-like isoform X2 [Citrus sinensis]